MDADSFFASVESAKNPALYGKPVITGSERGIATSMSYEAKALGITRGMPVYKIKKEYPQAIIVSSDYEAYAMYSQRMFAIVRRYFNPPQKLIEQYGFTSAEFLQMNSSYVAPKAVEIAFQQTVVTVLILILSSQFGLGYVEISVCFFILFGLSHLLLYFFMNINLVFLYSSAAIIATFIFPYFVLHVPYGYIHNYIFHWVFYLIAGVSAWVYFGKRKLD